MKLINEFLKMANKDLKSSNILYEHHLYPQAMFYFSQSVEKANKAFALSTGKYTEKDMLDIRHDSTTIYKNGIIETKRRYKKLQRDLEKLPDFKNTEFVINLNIQDKIKECDNALGEFAEIQDGKLDLVFIPKQKIVKILEEIQTNEREIKEGISDIEKFELTEQMWNEQKNEIIMQLSNPNNKELSHYIEKGLNNSDLTAQQIEDLIKKMYYGLFLLLSISNPLYHLAVVTLPHSVLTRYPQNELYPSKIYTKRLAIVRNLPYLFNVQSKALKQLEEYCQEYVFTE